MKTFHDQYPKPTTESVIDPDTRRTEFLKRKLSRKEKLARRAAPLLLALVGIGFVGAKTGDAIIDANTKEYSYSSTTHTVVAGPNEGLEQIARTVHTTGEVADLRDIEQHLRDTNPNLANGLQNGEAVEAPDSAEVK